MASPLNHGKERLSPSAVSELPTATATTTATSTPPDLLRPFSRSPHPYHRTSYTGHGQSERLPHWSRTSSDSGTEADDESTGVLKGLPAPPLRPRKGLRAVEDGADLARARVRSSLKDVARAAGGGGSKERSQGKRVEVLRRLLEVALVVSVGAVVVRPEDVRSLAWVWRKGMYW